MRPGPVNNGGRSRGGVAPALLMDVQTPLGDVYYWSDRALEGIVPATTAGMDVPATQVVSVEWRHDTSEAILTFPTRFVFPDGLSVSMAGFTGPTFLNDTTGPITVPDATVRNVVSYKPIAAGLDHYPSSAAAPDAGVMTVIPAATVSYKPWLLDTASLTFNRSLQTDVGTLTAQNISGNVLYRDFETIMRRSVLEGSLFVLRYYDAAVEHAWIEQHGTLSVGDTADTVKLNLKQLFDTASIDAPSQSFSETCQLVWGESRCGATGATECLYTYQSCQVPERFVGILTAFEVNNPESAADVPTRTINRKRAW